MGLGRVWEEVGGSGTGSEACGAGAPPDHPMPLVPVQCFSFNGRDKAEIVKWPEAKQACENQGAVLATISNPLEQGRSPPATTTTSSPTAAGAAPQHLAIPHSFHHVHAAEHLLRPLDRPPRRQEGVPVGGGRAAAARELGAR